MAWFVPAIIAGASALSQYLANRKKKTEQEQSNATGTTQTLFGTTSSQTTPTFDPFTEAFRKKLGSLYTNRMYEDPSRLVDSILTRNLQGLNKGSEIARRIASNTMAARGLGFSPATGAVLSGMESERVGKGIDILGQRDLMIEDLIKSRLAEASNFFQMQPVGSSTTGQTSQTGTQIGEQTSTGTLQTPGNQLGGMFTNLTSGLASMYAAGAFSRSGSKKKP
jgi:hypothetical protein